MNIYTMEMSKGGGNKVGRSKYEKQVDKIFNKYGWVLERNTNHLIYKHPITRKNRVISKSPTCDSRTLIREEQKLIKWKNNEWKNHEFNKQNIESSERTNNE